jgi:hypothetical protein
MAEHRIQSSAQKGKELAEDDHTAGILPAPEGTTPIHARIVVSRKIGWSQGFGNEKADVMMSVELPCGTTDASIHRTIDRASRLLDERLTAEMDKVVDTYFGGGPVVFGSGSGGQKGGPR